MRSAARILVATFLFCAMAMLAFGQTPTLVSGQVKDANGLPYSFAKISASLVGIPPNVNATIIVNGIPAAIGGQQNANADANGNFTMNLFCNSAGGGCSVISPGGTQWQFTVNENGSPPPIGTGPQTCSATLTITGASQSVSASFAACPAQTIAITSLSSLTLTGLTVGNCVQVGTGGLLTTTASSCGTSAGTVTVTGTPGAGNLAFFSGGTSIANGNLSGDVTTSGTGATTLATVATPGANTKITFDAKGRVTAGAQAQLASADFANQGTVHGILHGNAAGNPAFGSIDLTTEVANTLPAAQMSQVNLAASGNGGVGGTLPGANMSQVNLSASGNGGVGGILPGANMSQVNLAATGNGGVGGTLPSGNLGASTSNCTGQNFAQGWNSGGTPICNPVVASGLPSVVYSTPSASTNASIAGTTMATAGGSGNTYRFSWYADVTAAGTSCTTSSTVRVEVTYTDPNSSSITFAFTSGFQGTSLLTAFNLGGVGANATVGTSIPDQSLSNFVLPITFRSKASNAVQYATTFTPGSNCAPAASYQLYPVLEQLQ